MVAKGQILERPTLIPVGQWVLEGVSHRGGLRPLLLVIPPTPGEEGGGMDHVVGAEIAFAAATAGHPTLRFNFRGVGASQGKRGESAALVEDALGALAVALDNGAGDPVLVASINGGDAIALELARRAKSNVIGLCLVSPLRTSPAQWPSDVWVIVGELDDSQSWSTFGSGGRRVERIPNADRTFQRGLPLVGRAVVSCLSEAATSQKH